VHLSTGDTSFSEVEIIDRLKNQCARREYCSADILQKLGREGIVGEKAAAILEELRDGKWVDDARYAGCYTREKASIAGWGPVKIRYHLAAKGIAPEAVRQALEEIDERRAEQRRTDVLEMKWREICRKEADGMKRRAKMLRFAMGRGYSPEDARSVMKENQ